MKKFSMDEATFDKFKKLIAEGDEMDMALDDSDGKSFRDVVSAISEECGLQVNNCGYSEAELGDEYMTVGLVYDDRYNEVCIKSIGVEFYNSNPSALQSVHSKFNSLMKFVMDTRNTSL